MLETISSPKDLKALTLGQKKALAEEIRSEILNTVSKNGGHLASNLGTVELTIALHSVMDLPSDKLIFDVGHQCYTHKLLTGRQDAFHTLRKSGGISGFTRIDESEYDVNCSGHASDSISLAVGMAKARDLMGGKEKIAVLLGDGALSGGMCFEALNDAGQSRTPLVIVLNDNEMSISKNVGAISKYLTHMRQSGIYRGFKQFVRSLVDKLPSGGKGTRKFLTRMKDAFKSLVVSDSFFGSLDVEYLGPIDGHDIRELERVLKKAFTYDKPVVVHAVTKKGKGYRFAEEQPHKFHGVDPFNPATGEPLKKKAPTMGAFAAAKLAEMGNGNQSVAAITAGMLDGTGLECFRKIHPERCYDVGISEEHAAALAAGMSLKGMRPYLAVYSTFLQRAYDQVNIDICLNKVPVTLLIDRAGLNGADGETHQGVFDVSLLMGLPNLTICSPATRQELMRDMELSLEQSGPFAIRYPKTLPEGNYEPFEAGVWEEVEPISDNVIITFGRMTEICGRVCEKLKEKGISAGLVNARTLKPMDEKELKRIAETAKHVFTVEDDMLPGSFGNAAAGRLRTYRHDLDITVLALPERYIPAGSIEQQLKMCGLDADTITSKMITKIQEQA